MSGEGVQYVTDECPCKTRLSVHLHSNSIVASKFFRYASGHRRAPCTRSRAARPATRPARTTRPATAPARRRPLPARAATSRDQRDVRAKCLRVAQLEAAFPQPGRKPLDERQQCRRRLLRGAGRAGSSGARTSIAIKMQHKTCHRMSTSARPGRLSTRLDAFCGDCAEKNDGNVQIAGGDRAPERGMRLHVGAEPRRGRASVGHRAKNRRRFSAGVIGIAS